MLIGVTSVFRFRPLRRGYMALAAAVNNHVLLSPCTSRPQTQSRQSAASSAAVRRLSILTTQYSYQAFLSISSYPCGQIHPHTHTAAAISAANMSKNASDSVSNGTAVSTVAVQVCDTISPTPREQELFDTLLAAARYGDEETSLRCAGGWVRDKLLGRDSDDIDIALDDMLGKDFAELVQRYLQSKGKETHHAAVIQSNPGQSKHLETARMKIGGVWIDLVNLRSETYASDSRIPTMTFGTPEQDALRRDFTINALFYNITAGGVVEDLTGQGLQDLRDGLLRTPLPPRVTFLDDPLRVLRAVRFGSRFGFRLHPDILEAVALEQVRVGLATKVSKERIGTELEGMFNGPAPVEAVRLLHRLGLFNCVFSLPALESRLGTSYGAPCCATMAAADMVVRALGLELDKDERRFVLLAALLMPLRGLQLPAVKGKQVTATAAVIRDSLKWRVKDIEMTAALHDAAVELVAAHAVLRCSSVDGSANAASGGSGVNSSVGEQDFRVMLGHAIRKLKQHWRLGIALAPVIQMRAATSLNQGDYPSWSASASAAASTLGSEVDSDGAGELSEEAAARRLEMARELLVAVEAYGLGDCWTWKPLMNGKKVMSLLGWSKPGPDLGKVMSMVTDWQLMHPSGSLEEAEAMILEKYAVGPPTV